MTDETQDPMDGLLSAMDEIGRARDMLELLFLAGGGLGGGRDPSGTAITYGASIAQDVLDEARAKLEAVRLALGGQPLPRAMAV